MEHQLRPPRGFDDIFNPFSLKFFESHVGRDLAHSVPKSILVGISITNDNYVRYFGSNVTFEYVSL